MVRFFIDFSSYLVFFPLFIGLLYYRYLGAELKIILGLVLLGSITEVFADIYQMIWEQNTMPIGNVYLPISIIILSFYYLKTLKGFVNRQFIVGLIILYGLFCVINLLFIQNLYEFPSISGALGALLMLFFTILLFSKIMTEAKITHLFKAPIVWINLGVLIYYSASFFYFTLFNYSIQISTSFAYLTVIVNASVAIIFYIIIAIGFWKAGRQKIG